MIIQAKQNILNKEIEDLQQHIEYYDKLLKLMKILSSISLSKLNDSKIELSNKINKLYSYKTINQSISVFYSILSKNYFSIFNAQITEDEENFKVTIYKELYKTTIEDIIKPMAFKHNKIKLKAKVWLNVFLIAGLAIMFFYLAHELFRTYEYGSSEPKWGVILNMIGGILLLVALGKLSFISKVESEKVLLIIKNEQNEDFNELLKYLNSIHKIPTEIRDLIK
jgi:hypothetical protein